MTNLFRADLKRVLKDKLLLVMGILAVVFALITPLLYAAIFSSDGLLDDPLFASLVTAKSQFFQSFSMTNNLGLIAPVLLAIVLCKDFSFGTVRNKVMRTYILISSSENCFRSSSPHLLCPAPLSPSSSEP